MNRTALRMALRQALSGQRPMRMGALGVGQKADPHAVRNMMLGTAAGAAGGGGFARYMEDATYPHRVETRMRVDRTAREQALSQQEMDALSRMEAEMQALRDAYSANMEDGTLYSSRRRRFAANEE